MNRFRKYLHSGDAGQGDKVIQADHIPVQYTGVGKPSGKSFSHRHNRQLLEGLSDGLKLKTILVKKHSCKKSGLVRPYP